MLILCDTYLPSKIICFKQTFITAICLSEVSPHMHEIMPTAHYMFPDSMNIHQSSHPLDINLDIHKFIYYNSQHNKASADQRPPSPRQLITRILPGFQIWSQHGDPDHPQNFHQLFLVSLQSYPENFINIRSFFIK